MTTLKESKKMVQIKALHLEIWDKLLEEDAEDAEKYIKYCHKI
jgi:hypothetical protein